MVQTFKLIQLHFKSVGGFHLVLNFYLFSMLLNKNIRENDLFMGWRKTIHVLLFSLPLLSLLSSLFLSSDEKTNTSIFPPLRKTPGYKAKPDGRTNR